MDNINKKTSYIAIASDNINPAHINLINKASKKGKLIIGVLTDQAIATYKRLPSLSVKDRLVMAQSIKGVYKVVIQEELDYTINLKRYKPIIYSMEMNGKKACKNK